MQQEILEYQRVDGELRRIKRELEKNEFRVQGIKLNNLRTETESQLSKFDTKASELKNSAATLEKEHQKLTGVLKDYLKLVEDIADVDEAIYMKRKISLQLESISAIERECKALLKDAEASIAQYNELSAKIPKIASAINKYNSEFNKVIAEIQPTIKDLQARQNQLEKQLDQEQLALYKKIRQHNIHPVFVEYNNGSCGGCRMEISGGAVSNLNAKGQIRCEHCGRVIFKGK